MDIQLEGKENLSAMLTREKPRFPIYCTKANF
jgi:hypothetical protein